MPFIIDDSISFGHYAIWTMPLMMIQLRLDTMPFELCLLWFMIQFVWTLCHAIWTMLIYDWCFNLIWTLCRAIWTMLIYVQSHLDTMSCHLSHANLWLMFQYHLDTILCHMNYANLWLMIQFGLYAALMELCYDPIPLEHCAMPFGLCKVWLIEHDVLLTNAMTGNVWTPAKLSNWYYALSCCCLVSIICANYVLCFNLPFYTTTTTNSPFLSPRYTWSNC